MLRSLHSPDIDGGFLSGLQSDIFISVFRLCGTRRNEPGQMMLSTVVCRGEQHGPRVDRDVITWKRQTDVVQIGGNL